MNHLIKDFASYQVLYKKSVEDPESFWSGVANDFKWRKKWEVLEWDFSKPEVKWFINGKLNIKKIVCIVT